MCGADQVCDRAAIAPCLQRQCAKAMRTSCTLSCSPAHHRPATMQSLVTRSKLSVAAKPAGKRSVRVAAERTLWLPEVKAPAHLNGSLAGDFGFDPLGLGQNADR